MVHGVADLFVNKRNGHGKLMKRLPPIGGGGGGPAGGGGAGTGTGTGTGTGGGAGGGGAGGKGDPDPNTTTSKVIASAPPSPPPSKPTDDPTTTKAPPPPPPKTTTTKAAPPPQTTTSSTPSSTTLSTSSTPAVVPTIPPPVVLPTDSGILPPSTMAGYTPPFALTTDTGFTLNPSPTDTSALPSESASSSGSSTGSIVGIVAAAIAGVVVVGAAVSWVIRRKMKRGRRGDGFDSDEFLRNSVMIPDDMAERSAPMGTQNALSIARANANNGPSRTPRPPSTIERHVAASRNHQAPPLPSMNPGQFAQQDDFFSASYGSPDEYGQGGRNLTSVTPYQQEQYAAISRQLDFGQQPTDYPPSSELQRQPSGSEHAHYGYAYSPEPSSHHLPNPHDGAGPFADDHGMAPPPVLMAGRHPADTGRSGTPVMANPQQAYRAPHGGYPELSNQATPSRANIVNMPPTAAAHHGEVGFVGGHHGADNDDDAYGGI